MDSGINFHPLSLLDSLSFDIQYVYSVIRINK